MTSSVLTNDLELVGREVESKLLDALLGRLREGGGALVFRGEPGIGKSALLDHASERARARGVSVLSTTGVESEAELSFAGLHQLLHPIIGLIERLSDPQRRALEGAFGASGELEPDPFHVEQVTRYFSPVLQVVKRPIALAPEHELAN